MDGLRSQIITRDFDKMLVELSNMAPQVDFSTVVKAIATSVVQRAMDRTKAAAAGAIRANYASKEWTTLDGKRYKLSWLMPDPTWSAIMEKRQRNLASRLAARGLGKQSWLGIASAIGQAIDAPAYVRAAAYKNRQYSQDGTAWETASGTSYALTILNISPILPHAGGYGALLSSMAIETNKFRANMAHQFYLTAERRAAKYPGIFMREAA